MTRYIGQMARIGNTSTLTGPYNIELIGNPEEFEVSGRGEVMNVPSLGNTYLTAIETARVRPELSIAFNPQNTSYLHNYLIPNSGGNLSAHYVNYLANSADYGILLEAKPSRVEVNIPLNGPIVVRANLIGTNWSTGLETSTGNFSKAISSTEVAFHTKVTTVALYDAATAENVYTSLFRRANFVIDYKTVPIFTGTSVTPTDVLQGVREIRGIIETSVNESAPKMPYVTNASVLNVVIGIMNVPMSTTYTFFSSVIRTNVVTVPGTGVERQSIEFNNRYVVRSSL